MRPSMKSVRDAYDNALCEGFFATLECELLDRRRFRSQHEARQAIFEFVEGGTTRTAATRPSAIAQPPDSTCWLAMQAERPSPRLSTKPGQLQWQRHPAYPPCGGPK